MVKNYKFNTLVKVSILYLLTSIACVRATSLDQGITCSMRPVDEGTFLSLQAHSATGMQVTRNLGRYPDGTGSARELNMPPGLGEAVLFSKYFDPDRLSRNSEYIKLLEARLFTPIALSLSVRSEDESTIMRIRTNHPFYSLEIALDTRIITCPLNVYLDPNNPENFALVPTYRYDSFSLMDLYFCPDAGNLTRFFFFVNEKLHLMWPEQEGVTFFPINPEFLPEDVKEYKRSASELNSIGCPEFPLDDFHLEVTPTSSGSTFGVRVECGFYDAYNVFFLQRLTKTVSSPEAFNGFSGQPEDLTLAMESFLFHKYPSEERSDTRPLSDLANLHARLLGQSATDFTLTLHKSRGDTYVLTIKPVFDGESTLESALRLKLKLPEGSNLLTWVGASKMPVCLGEVVAYRPEYLELYT